MSSEMAIERPLGHDRVLEGLWRAAGEGRLAHALLVRGPEGVGKYLTARWLALGWLCAEGPGEPCLACGPCKRARAGSHPDLMLVDPTEEAREEITIHYVAHRESRPPGAYQGASIEDFLSLRAGEGGRRVVLVRGAELMNESAQNAFLKTLEEPGRDVHLVLVSSEPERLLDTVRSRLVEVELTALDPETARAVLSREGLAEAESAALVRWSRGAPGRALELARARALEARAILLAVLGAERDAAGAWRALGELEAEFPGRTPSAQARARTRLWLELGLELALDLERALAGRPLAELAHGDVLGPWVEGPAPAPGAAARERCMDRWLEARQDVDLNLAPDALLLRALHALEEAAAGADRR